jgi:hypothetical protein
VIVPADDVRVSTTWLAFVVSLISRQMYAKKNDMVPDNDVKRALRLEEADEARP